MKIKFLKDHRIAKAKLDVKKDDELIVSNALGKKLKKSGTAVILVDENGEIVTKNQ